MNMQKYSAWNPGLESDIPSDYQKLETIYRPENVSSLVSDVAEISTLTGLSHEKLVEFKPERLVVHELLIRVTENIVVDEGEDERGLGRDFRVIVNTIFKEFIQPNMSEILQAHANLSVRVRTLVQRKLEETLFKPHEPQIQKTGVASFLKQILGREQTGGKTSSSTKYAYADSIQEREHQAILSYKEKRRTAEDELEREVYKSLYRVLNLISGTRGYIGPDHSLLARLISTHVLNRYGSRVIGLQIEPWIDKAIEIKHYTRAVNAQTPILISLKGASAAGKSSLRAMLKQKLEGLGIAAHGYATISPDIWRHFLLDYNSLGEAYKYAGRLTGKEVIIIDGKLDHYIREKSSREGAIPHLLVDRFRFDSFSSEKIWTVLHGTYVQYVDTMYMYFIVTPPEATVERGWERGLTTGRYKSVEDFLDHSVEAYTGMPKIFFKWLAYEKPLFKYEFLDNSVPKGTYPATIAYGTQKEINIVDIRGFINIERYQKINIKAQSPEQVYPESMVLSIENNIEFLRQIMEKIPTVNFVDQNPNAIYLSVRKGHFSIDNEGVFADKCKDKQYLKIIQAIGWKF